MYRKRLFIVIAIVTVSSLAGAQVATRGSFGVSSASHPAGRDSAAILSAEPQRLSAQFERLATLAVAPGANNPARRDLVVFLREELMPYLTAGIVLYPLADSVGGTDGYAVASAIFDGEAIARQVTELERLTTADPNGFRARTLALGELLDLYFTKERLLVGSILAGLGEEELRALVEGIAVERVALRQR